MKVITFSRHFPGGHARNGQDTFFAEQILLELDKAKEVLDNPNNQLNK